MCAMLFGVFLLVLPASGQAIRGGLHMDPKLSTLDPTASRNHRLVPTSLRHKPPQQYLVFAASEVLPHPPPLFGLRV